MFGGPGNRCIRFYFAVIFTVSTELPRKLIDFHLTKPFSKNRCLQSEFENAVRHGLETLRHNLFKNGLSLTNLDLYTIRNKKQVHFEIKYSLKF